MEQETKLRYGPDAPDPRISEIDMSVMTRSQWIPRTDVEALEALRLEHERLIAVREAKQRERAELARKYEKEDEDYQAELNAAYAQGREPALPSLTSEDDRKKALAEAGAHAFAAARAVVAFAYDVRFKLRGTEELPDGWNPIHAADAYEVPPGGIADEVLSSLAGQEAVVREEAEKAKAVVEAALARLRELQPLKVWVARNANGANGQVLSADVLGVAPSHTLMTKPRDLEVEGFWQSAEGEGNPRPIDGAIDPDYLGAMDPDEAQMLDAGTSRPVDDGLRGER